MKVLHLIDSEGIYGAEVVLLHLMAEQKKRSVEPILGSIGKHEIQEKDIETAARLKGINVKKFRMKNGPNLLGSISIIRFAKQQHIDILHCHGYKANILVSMLPSHFRKIPYLVTVHGWTSVKRFSKLWFYWWADVFCAKRADLVVVVSDAMKNHPGILTTGLKPVVVHNGIPQALPRSKPNHHPEPLDAFCNKTFVIGAVGRLSPEKGFDLLINAVARVIERGYDVSLVIIGEGEERSRLEDIVSTKNITDKVYFTGYLDQASQYLHYFNVFIISSLTEGLPITLLEAMQKSVPIIATRVGGIPEVLDNGEYGLLVNPGNEHELAEAIITFHDSPEKRKKLCTAARERVNHLFSLETMEHGYRKLYEKLLEN